MEVDMIFGGSCTARSAGPRPVGAEPVAAGSSVWRLGPGPVRVSPTRGGRRRVAVLGWSGCSDQDFGRLVDAPLPSDVTWRWPGTYTVVDENEEVVALYTDPAAAQPVYLTRHENDWVWCSSARTLAALTGAGIDTQRLTCTIFLPSAPALANGRTFFTGVEQLPPGSRIELPRDGRAPRRVTVWRPTSEDAPEQRLRHALNAAVVLRTAADPSLACDMSGGLDSTSLAVLAAQALPPDSELNAVTIHPEGDETGADLRYACLTAAAHAGRIAHRLLPLTDEHRPYTRITTVPATDEPAPSTLTQARLTGQFRWMKERLGTRTHMTGDGGDSVLFQPPIRLADLLRHRSIRRTVGEALGWARLRRRPALPLLRDAAAVARGSRHEALVDLARTVGTPGRDDHGLVRWFPLMPFPSWAEPAARKELVAAAHEAATAPDQLPGLDFSVRTLVDEIREVARTATADAALARSCGIDLHNPFLDAVVVDTVLRTPPDRRPAVHEYKPLLRRAMADLLPPEVAARTTKGSFEADHYTGMRANLPDLLPLADGHLASFGLLSPDRFRRSLREASAGVPMPLATVEQALMAEVWLIAHHREPTPVWTYEPVGSAHG
ncbi:albusnodin/ikarugamycin family macrolactam cyclase [Streptomyces sp. NPDC020141]|uniref:albusnodin/ikarugamycin family macrolactam cyclase n=1 Tax=Streptomyces sp. NPDC020141 TaxID=3365065 RepID=UPI0037AF4E26